MFTICFVSELRAQPIGTYDVAMPERTGSAELIARQLVDSIDRLGAESVLVLRRKEADVLGDLPDRIGVHVTELTVGIDGLGQALRQHDVVVIELPTNTDEGSARAALHTAAQHAGRFGAVVVVHDAALPERCGLDAPDFVVGHSIIGTRMITTLHRGHRTTIHDLVFDARSTIRRIEPNELFHRLASSTPPLVVDTRTHTDRWRFGVIDQSIHVPLSVAEWHLDPANGYLHPAMESFDQPLVVMCNGGYSSSLTAANLVKIGFTEVADLIGGFAAWLASGLPVDRPDHSHVGW